MKKFNLGLEEILSIGFGALVTFGIDLLLRSIDNNARQEEIREEVARQLAEREIANEN